MQLKIQKLFFLSTFRFLDEPVAVKEPGYRCATYIRGNEREEHCAICGDGVCDEFENRTPSSCLLPDEYGDVKCTEDCGKLYCKEDCQ